MCRTLGYMRCNGRVPIRLWWCYRVLWHVHELPLLLCVLLQVVLLLLLTKYLYSIVVVYVRLARRRRCKHARLHSHGNGSHSSWGHDCARRCRLLLLTSHCCRTTALRGLSGSGSTGGGGGGGAGG